MLEITVDAPLRGVVVIPSEFEPIDSILRRFKKACDKANIIRDHRDHEYFVKPSQRRRQKRLRAARSGDLAGPYISDPPAIVKEPQRAL